LSDGSESGSAGLLRLENSLLRHCLRLQCAERNLSDFVRRHRRGSGRGAVRQIELERQHLGRELHTGLGQMLAAIRLQLEIVATLLPDPPTTLWNRCAPSPGGCTPPSGSG